MAAEPSMSGRNIRRMALGVALAIGLITAPLGVAERVGAQAPQGAPAQDGTISIPLRVVNGHLIILTDLVGLRYTNEASFEVSLEYPDALTLHPDQYQWLGLPPGDIGLSDGPQIRILIQGG